MLSTLAFSMFVAARAAALPIPESVKVEHEHLQRTLAAVTQLPGETGTAAVEVRERLHAHFVKEEAFALPPLGALRDIVSGRATAGQQQEARALSERLKGEMPRMLAEHEAIVEALGRLERAAKAAGHSEAVHFVAQLKLHAQHEEEVLYPAALLVGAYLAQR